MISKTLPHTKMATYSILLPHSDPSQKGLPIAKGTGFFVSKDGYFITARHVLTKKGGGLVSSPPIILQKPDAFPGPMIRNVKIVREWPNFDLVLLKADFSECQNQDFFKNKNGFDYLNIDFSLIPEGTEVYSFGYPLAKYDIQKGTYVTVAFHYSFPRVTSAVISSHYDVIGPVFSPSFPKFYVIDKALNYGNSGGPIITENNGKVISVCVRFQPTRIPQNKTVSVFIPSLYGITVSLKNIESDLSSLFVPSCAHDYKEIAVKSKYVLKKCSKCDKIEKEWK